MTRTVALADGSALEIAEFGDLDGQPVVFQPGTPATCGAAQLVAQAAVRHGVRLVSVSRPGYGASPPTPPGLASVAGLVVQLADALGLERFGVWGLSGGGPYALAQAAVAPDRVTRVVVTAGPGPGAAVQTPAELRAEAAGMAAHFAGLDVPGFVAQTPPGERFFRDHPDLADVFLRGIRQALSGPDGYVRDNLSWQGPWDVELSDVRAPVDLVYGDSDAMVELENGRRIAQAVAHAELRVLPGSGHGSATFGAADLALRLLTEG